MNPNFSIQFRTNDWGRNQLSFTSNRPLEDGYYVFPNLVIGGVILDRLISGAIKGIVTKGKSY